MAGLGPVVVREPRVRDRAAAADIPAASASRRRSCRRTCDAASRSRRFALVLYLKGISTGDFSEALQTLGRMRRDSARAIGRLKDGWTTIVPLDATRSLAARRYVYLWADGVHCSSGSKDEQQCILVIIGATPDGTKELLGFIDGYRESEQSLEELLLELKGRGPRRSAGADLGRRGARASGRPARCAPRRRAAVLGAQDGERAEQAAQGPAAEGQGGSARDLDGRDQCEGRGGVRPLRRRPSRRSTRRPRSAWRRIARCC